MPKSNVRNANPMTRDELLELQNAVASVGLQDRAVGQVLDAMLSHLARLNNLDYPVSVEADAAPAEEVPVEQASSQEGAQ